jgi:hypothetical protein
MMRRLLAGLLSALLVTSSIAQTASPNTSSKTVNVSTITGTLPVSKGGTGVTTSTGSGATVLGTLPNFTTGITLNSGSTLAAYSTSTWACVLGATSGSAVPGLAVCHYTRIGRLVFAQFYMTGTKGTLSGGLKITGLPVASNSTANVFHNFPIATWSHPSGTAYLRIDGQMAPASTEFILTGLAAASTNSQTLTVSATDLSSAYQWLGTVVYQTD